MRILPILLFFLSPTLLFSQKMLESHEWCPKKHTFLRPEVLNIQDGRSDSLDILQTNIRLNLLALPQVSAACQIEVLAKIVGQQSMRLDLLNMTVDSVTTPGGIPLTFLHIGPNLNIDFPQAISTSSPTLFTIYYRGIPASDASGWGGYYNTGGYTFNLGVGFAADPHSYGRAWFPCFDNFVERSAMQITILSPNGRRGYSNGLLTEESLVPGGVSHTWMLEESIPSYLACFASGPYTSFTRQYTGMEGSIPLEIAAAPADTNKVKGTFVNMQSAISVFEDWFGPYRWPKIGYSLVPFNSGAMEHATNIAIGRGFIDGSLNYETLWAHELGHMWWGDLATCSTAEDMWLNEGWASYCEHLFTEKVYGQTAFRKSVRDNHLNVLQNAHVNEGGYRAVSGLPHSLTYGAHVYNKGASMAHNLRGYLGDSLFQKGCSAALSATQFEDWSSDDFRIQLESATGQDLHSFFGDWVFAGGYPDYSLDSFQLQFFPADGGIARLYVKQKLRGAPQLHENVPLEFTFILANGQRETHTGIVSGETSVLEFDINSWLPPVSIFVNTNQKILQARSEGEKMLLNTGGSNFSDAKFNLTVNVLGADSVLFRVEHHFAMPDTAGANPNGYALSNRYWSIQTMGGAFPSGFDAQAVLVYDGRGSLDQLDTELFAANGPSEDDLRLLYRRGAGYPWQEWPSYTKITLGSTSDRFGQLRPTLLQAGEYTIGKGSTGTATHTPKPLGNILVQPNPAKHSVRVRAEKDFDTITLINAAGETVKSVQTGPQSEYLLDLAGILPGTYWIALQGKTGIALAPLVKQ